jgi:hypothetical protein
VQCDGAEKVEAYQGNREDVIAARRYSGVDLAVGADEPLVAVALALDASAGAGAQFAVEDARPRRQHMLTFTHHLNITKNHINLKLMIKNRT